MFDEDTAASSEEEREEMARHRIARLTSHMIVRLQPFVDGSHFLDFLCC